MKKKEWKKATEELVASALEIMHLPPSSNSDDAD